ncbi:MAG: hypothetical protein ABI282_09890 [Candidatus Baltobacteraceae bacterium]
MFKFFARFASSQPPDPCERALRALKRGELESAEAQFTALLTEGVPALQRAFLLNKRGAARARLGNRDMARADFEAALEVVPNYAPSLVNVGNLALEDGLTGEAVKRYESAIVADARYAAAYFNLSVAYKRQERFGEAVSALRTAQKLEARIRLGKNGRRC